MGLWSLAAYLAAAIVVASAKSSVGNEVLVVLEPNLKREDYSIFFDGLESEWGFRMA
jgi:oligosaccharyltransferase complex subunit beta